MPLSPCKILKAQKIKLTLDDYFKDSTVQSIQAKELMPLFIKKGIFTSNHRDGLPLRNLLRELHTAGQLSLIPQVHFEQKAKNKNWYFVKTS